jgi:hypothetical protein
VLDPVAAVVLVEDVDLRRLERRPPRLVVRELHGRARVAHHDGADARAVLGLLRRAPRLGGVLRVELHLPELLEAEDVLHPEQRRLHRLEVGGEVVDLAEPERVPAALRLRVADEPREDPLVAAPLDEAERRVAERGRDAERPVRPAVVAVLLHVGDRRRAALLEEPEAAPGVLHLEHDRADAVGVLAQVAPRAPAVAARLRADDAHVARLEDGAPLAALLLELRPARGDLREVEPPHVEAAAPLEIVDVVVQRLDADEPDGLERGLRHGVLLSGGGASGCRSGCAAWNGASAAQASSIRRSVG